MKKLILFIALILFAFNAKAQDSPTRDTGAISVGAKAGVNFADITGDEVDSFSGRTSFHLGLIVEIPVSDTFSLQPEIMYSGQGSDWEDEGYSGTVKLDYINVPVMAKLYVGEGGFSIEVGPQVGFLISAKEEEDGEEIDIDDWVKGTDFGVNLGLGYRMESGLSIGARYNLGLSDNLDVDDFEADGAEYKNSVIQISLGYFF